ncbi:mitochondrial F1F0-ATP synthase-like protein g subunit [Pleomassaria siparia CBS 279.74]|uniref:Mitochondrial F1F0-ATP synthase-like protein g subunit n=1 Tax=Pleomassaria siparia CBS 279.74 TaxID=1314801 RepID=A0A6G1KLI0_9PLEO|nr:mitochondrial F1F0-ATP synthase-like protein g subunit [Pleomassaria siparia CBS 279.74]
MSLAASRSVLRHTVFTARRAGIRNASNTSEAAAAAKEKAAAFQSKASEGLSRVTSSAGSALSKAGSTASEALGKSAEALGKVGGRTGQVVGGVQSLIPQTVYYSKVGLELTKLVAKERGIALPDVATFQGYFQPAINALRNPASLVSRTTSFANSSAAQPANIIQRVRSLTSTEIISTSVIVAEVIGFFSVGEIIGRFKLVGYTSKEPVHH